MKGKIFSPGKLLITSEYAVLDGALALAVPTQPGQDFFYEEIKDGKSLVHWAAFHEEKPWLDAVIDYRKWEIISTNRPQPAEFILKTLKNLQQLSPSKFLNGDSYLLKTNLQFPPDYGLGSSSTLMNNLAEWASADAFALNDLSLGGSGYDIAVAREKSAVLFQIKNGKRETQKVNFSPDFKAELIFIHLNKKQDSREGINLFKKLKKTPEMLSEFSEITKKVVACHQIWEFSELMILHENILSKFLGLTTAKQLYFGDSEVFVKSLGAWGGDFVLSQKFDGFKNYFFDKGFNKIFNWNEIILE